MSRISKFSLFARRKANFVKIFFEVKNEKINAGKYLFKKYSS
jgi:hypothetical protein